MPTELHPIKYVNSISFKAHVNTFLFRHEYTNGDFNNTFANYLSISFYLIVYIFNSLVHAIFLVTYLFIIFRIYNLRMRI